MTKLEKWKREVTVETLKQGDRSVGLECDICPAILECNEGQGKKTCLESFEEWAEQEAED